MDQERRLTPQERRAREILKRDCGKDLSVADPVTTVFAIESILPGWQVWQINDLDSPPNPLEKQIDLSVLRLSGYGIPEYFNAIVIHPKETEPPELIQDFEPPTAIDQLPHLKNHPQKFLKVIISTSSSFHLADEEGQLPVLFSPKVTVRVGDSYERSGYPTNNNIVTFNNKGEINISRFYDPRRDLEENKAAQNILIFSGCKLQINEQSAGVIIK